MEKVTEGTVSIRMAEYSGAVALHGFLKNSPLAEKYRRGMLDLERGLEVVNYCGLEDFEEYEAGHDLPRGTYKSIFKAFSDDLEAKKDKSEIYNIRSRVSGENLGNILFSAEDLQHLAGKILVREAAVHGIGPVKAQRLLEGTSVLLALGQIEDDL